MGKSDIDHILFVGFGAPERAEDVPAFLRHVSNGRRIPESRLAEVTHHYEAIGGGTPYNAQTFQLTGHVTAALKSKGIELPVFVGMRNWHPYLKEVVMEIQGRGLKRGFGIILSPFRSETSCWRYRQNVQEAQSEAGVSIDYEFAGPWYNHPAFIQAQAKEVSREVSKILSAGRQKPYLLFTAHSIPKTMLELCRECRYDHEFETASRLVSENFPGVSWGLAYQSRSGNPNDPWLEPDVTRMLGQLKNKGIENVVLVPIGFFCENAEILYDLDIEAGQAARSLGLSVSRTRTVAQNPAFANMFADLIQAAIYKMISS